MRALDLSSNWKVHEGPLSFSPDDIAQVQRWKEGWLDCSLPSDARQPLIREGLVRDPVLSDYAAGGLWVERRSWWFERRFSSDALDMDAPHIELFAESIDARGEVFLNGIHIGTHRSAHYPFVRQVKELLRAGENILTIRVTTGFETVTDEDLAELGYQEKREPESNMEGRGDLRRVCVRKPQYTVGWDWTARAVSVGLAGGVELRCLYDAEIRGVRVDTLRTSPSALVRVEAEVELTKFVSTADADIFVEILRGEKPVAQAEIKDTLLCAGINYVPAELEIETPELWWPAGYGGQPRYEVRVRVTCGGRAHAYKPLLVGLRTVGLDVSHASDGRRFAFMVNGERIFCKGGDYIPNDLVYMRATPARRETLVREAAAAGFNMLRIWGGGVYEREDFYDACDKYGIMLWHDFMFACAVYPDHHEAFVSLVRKEMDYQTKRLNHHPCMALWCGNNENQMCCDSMPFTLDKQYGNLLANTLGRRIVRENTSIPYWNSSPFGGEKPNDEHTGDIHHWHAFMMNPDIERRIEPLLFDATSPKFVSEYGFPGPPCMETIHEYMDFKPFAVGDKIWLEHTNTFEKHTVARAVEKHYGLDASALTLEQYLLYAGLVQMTMYEYSLESFRAKPECAGALFWMYNDAWGEIGWTIIDYALRRKISYYGVRRVFAPVKLILRRECDDIVLTGCNDTPQDVTLEAELGVFILDGAYRDTNKLALMLPARSRTELARVPAPAYDAARSVFAVLPTVLGVDMAVLRTGDISSLKRERPKLDVSYVRDGGDMLVTITSGVYVHGIHVDLSLRADDNFFDLLPGQTRTVRVFNCDIQPEVLTV